MARNMLKKLSSIKLNPRILLAGITIAVSCCAISGFFGRFWWPFELLSHFRLQYFVILLACVIAYLVGKKYLSALLITTVLIINFTSIGSLFLGSQTIASGGPTLRALLVNVNVSNREFERVTDFIQSTNPDIIIIVEVDNFWMEAIKEVRNEYPYNTSEPRNDGFGIALLSRIPFESAKILDIGGFGAPSVIARFDIEGKSLTLVGTHLLPPVDYIQDRKDQSAALANFVSSQKGRVVVLGDLNMTSWSPLFKDLLNESGLQDSRIGRGIQPTWPVVMPLFLIPIDHCLISKGLTVHERKVGSNVGSDHYPVIIDISVIDYEYST